MERRWSCSPLWGKSWKKIMTSWQRNQRGTGCQPPPISCSCSTSLLKMLHLVVSMPRRRCRPGLYQPFNWPTLSSCWLVLEIGYGPLTTDIKNSNNHTKLYWQFIETGVKLSTQVVQSASKHAKHRSPDCCRTPTTWTAIAESSDGDYTSQVNLNISCNAASSPPSLNPLYSRKSFCQKKP